jgi:hypothetical protein
VSGKSHLCLPYGVVELFLSNTLKVDVGVFYHQVIRYKSCSSS